MCLKALEVIYKGNIRKILFHFFQSVIEDLLHSVTEFRTPPNLNSPFAKVLTMRDIAAALSACIYQSLCDSDNFIVAMTDGISIGMEGFTRYVS